MALAALAGAALLVLYMMSGCLMQSPAGGGEVRVPVGSQGEGTIDSKRDSGVYDGQPTRPGSQSGEIHQSGDNSASSGSLNSPSTSGIRGKTSTGSSSQAGDELDGSSNTNQGGKGDAADSTASTGRRAPPSGSKTSSKPLEMEFSGGYGAEVVHGSWIVDEGKTYEEAGKEIGADKEQASWGASPGSTSDSSLRLLATIRKPPGVTFRMALPTRAEDEFRADIAKNGDYYDTGLSEYIRWSLHVFLPRLGGDDASYETLGAQAYADAEPGQFLDVGCNAGWATLVAVSLGARATCVEPNPRLNTRVRMSRALSLTDKVPGTILLVPGGADSVSSRGRMEFSTKKTFGTATLAPKGTSRTSDADCKGSGPGQSPSGTKWCFDVNAYSLDDVLLDDTSPLGAPPGRIRPFLQAAKLSPADAQAQAEANEASYKARLGKPANKNTKHISKGPPIAMKLDIEGMEPEALRGMTTMLNAGAVKVLRAEYVPSHLKLHGSSGLEMLGIMYDAGFRIFFHEAKTAANYASYSCQAGWSVPTVARDSIEQFARTAYPGAPEAVNSDVILVHSTAMATFTREMAHKLYASFPLASIDCTAA